jgi:hypothetical protein
MGLTALLCSLLLADISRADALELVTDPHFEKGVRVYDMKPGALVPVGSLRPPKNAAEPVWGLAQWGSRYNILDAPPETMPSGAVRFANAAKALVFGAGCSEDSDIVLEVDSRPEYENTARRPDQPWVHLLLDQRIAEPGGVGPGCPPLAELRALRLSVKARLLTAERFEVEGYSRAIHAAQFQIFLTVQNLNENSSHFGDYLWLGVPMYDDRWPMPPRAVSGDPGTGKLIYTEAAEKFASKSMHSGEWVSFEGDVLPSALAALEEACRRGFLAGSRNLADYRIGGINIGWEVPGLHHVAIQVRGVGLEAVLKDARDQGGASVPRADRKPG